MERKAIDTFTPATFRGVVFKYVVYDNNIISYPTLGIKSKFKLRGDTTQYLNEREELSN